VKSTLLNYQENKGSEMRLACSFICDVTASVLEDTKMFLIAWISCLLE